MIFELVNESQRRTICIPFPKRLAHEPARSPTPVSSSGANPAKNLRGEPRPEPAGRTAPTESLGRTPPRAGGAGRRTPCSLARSFVPDGLTGRQGVGPRAPIGQGPSRSSTIRLMLGRAFNRYHTLFDPE